MKHTNTRTDFAVPNAALILPLSLCCFCFRKVKALAISTAMTVAVGTAASALLAYATSAEEAAGEPPVDDAAALERVERETEGEAKDSDRPEPNSIRRFLDDSFKGRGQPR